jgi:hypothetical protein
MQQSRLERALSSLPRLLMADLAAVAATIAFFACSWAYVCACERMG